MGTRRGEVPSCFERECCGADEGRLDPWLRGLFAVGTHLASVVQSIDKWFYSDEWK
jgi:hypothetical protein